METKRKKARLTKREKEIVDLMIDDKSNKEIAEKICRSIKTVDTHLRNIRSKYYFKTTRAFLYWLGEKKCREGV